MEIVSVEIEKFLLQNPWVIATLLVWTLPWKGVALWKAARRGHLGWFLAILILNTLAILEIIYLIFHRNKKNNNLAEQDFSRSEVEKMVQNNNAKIL